MHPVRHQRQGSALPDHDRGHGTPVLLLYRFQEGRHETLLEAALRELTEETGIPADAVTTVSHLPVHIDVHPIPANDAKGEPDHQHIDFRFLFRTTADIGQLQTEEVTGAAWRDPDTIGDLTLRQRVAHALR
ncbi:NUDIX domain-containing protein [Streptomyces sp. NPDC079020]|uniref:NUDIX domain-containing protein n=1 Tax=Streptomyces sp. NPDC079020 TaxID=3365722 RepID=UPI0037D37E3C